MVDRRKHPAGKRYSFYVKVDVSKTSFALEADGYAPDVFIDFPVHCIRLINEDAGADVVEYSFEGYQASGELVPGTTSPTRMLEFYNIAVSGIWFRVKSGSTGPITVRVDAW
jgi:hypothetical protein